jgi:hypothetical protein
LAWSYGILSPTNLSNPKRRLFIPISPKQQQTVFWPTDTIKRNTFSYQSFQSNKHLCLPIIPKLQYIFLYHYPNPTGYLPLPIFPIQRNVSSYPTLPNIIIGLPSLTHWHNPTGYLLLSIFHKTTRSLFLPISPKQHDTFFWPTTPIQRVNFHYQACQSNETSLPTHLSQTTTSAYCLLTSSPNPTGYFLLPIFPNQQNVSSYISVPNNNIKSSDAFPESSSLPFLNYLSQSNAISLLVCVYSRGFIFDKFRLQSSYNWADQITERKEGYVCNRGCVNKVGFKLY